MAAQKWRLKPAVDLCHDVLKREFMPVPYMDQSLANGQRSNQEVQADVALKR